MEVSSQGIKENRINGLDFEIGLFTNLTLDHLDYHKTFEDYFYTKAMFLSHCKHVIVNSDSNMFYLLNKVINKKLITFGKTISKEKPNYYINNTSYDIERTCFDLLIDDQNFHIESSMLGEYNIYNVTSFIAIIDLLGYFNNYTLSFLKKKISIDGRFEVIETNKGKFVIDFAHTPDGVSNILSLLDSFKTGKLITVIGMGGNRDKSKREIVGKILDNMSDVIILTEDNSRNENVIDIIEDIKKGITKTNEVYIIPNRKEAIIKAYSISNKNDIIALLGKGNEKYIETNDKFIYFQDKEEVYKLGK